jgi:hypothetical protein
MDVNENNIRSSILFDSKNDVLIILDHTNKVYIEADRQLLEKQRQAKASVQEQRLAQIMEQHAQDLSEEQRKALRENISKMLGNLAPRVDKTQETLKISGIDCQIVKIYIGENLRQQWCVTGWQALGLSEADYRMFEELMILLEGVIGSELKASDVFAQIEGLPIRTVQYQQDVQWYVSELRQITGSGVDSDLFRIPKSYKKADLNQ